MPQGAPVRRHFALDGYEFYGQDSWRAKPNLTITFGLRYSIAPAPWETTGLQVAPCELSGTTCQSLSMGKWFDQRAWDMEHGIPSNQDPLVSFQLAGPANGRSGFYHTDYRNFGPRLALAWAPKPTGDLTKKLFGERGQTSVRAGFGIVYDRISSTLADTFDSGGSFGLSSIIQNPATVETADCAPRLSSMNVIPTGDLCGNQLLVSAPPGKFPQTFPNSLSDGGFCICFGMDDRLKTPYSYTLDLSLGRELRGGFSLEASYVGRLSHRLLAQSDLAMPLDFKDPKSGVSLFDAETALAKVYRRGVPSNQVTSAMIGPTAAYWTNMLQPLKPGDQYQMRCLAPGGTSSPLQAAYDLFGCNNLIETNGIFALDFFGIPGTDQCGGSSCNSYTWTTGFNSIFNPQYSSLMAWRTNTNADYHALQVNLRRRMAHGVQFDFNYTLSKSIDVMSDATRIGETGGLNGVIVNSWQPYAMRAVSDFDLRHQFNSNWIFLMPFGAGRKFGANARPALDAVIGGWQLSGIFRLTSGFPVTITNGAAWPTNWSVVGNAYLTSPVKTGSFYQPDGNVNVFSNGPEAISAFSHPFPGESGARNQVRGPGYFDLDSALAKSWKMPWSEKQRLQFRWEVFNVPNSKSFNAQSIVNQLGVSSTFGNFTGLLTSPRVMQFGLRYEF